MALSQTAALRKDHRTTVKLEHRHFAEIARIIRSLQSEMMPSEIGIVAAHFAKELRDSNSRFDKQRFIAACKPEY